MNNNDIIRRMRFIFNFNNPMMMDVWALAGMAVERDQIRSWLKKDDEAGYVQCQDEQLAAFLNGFITLKRGKRDDAPEMPNEKRLTNNMVFRKLKIALAMQDTDVIDALALAGMTFSKHEISSFLRKEGHRNYRKCENQVLRNFLKGLQRHHRPMKPSAAKTDEANELDEAFDDAKLEAEEQKAQEQSNGGFSWKKPKK